MGTIIVRLSALALVLGSVFATASASALIDVPAVCSVPRNARLMTLGERKGVSLARQSFASIAIDSDCDNVDAYGQAVLATVAGLSLGSPTDAALCHFVGTVNGLLGEVAAIQLDCAETCFLDGSFVGELAGLLYCELSIALGGLSPDVAFTAGLVGICGTSFEAACFEVFEEVTTADETCEPFTALDPPADPELDFTEVWEETRNNQCLYNPDI